MAVTASVAAACTVSATPLAFGTYNPIGGTDLDAEATVTVTCTSGTDAWIGLGEGSNADSGSSADAPLRRLGDGTNFLSYALYSDSGRTTAWADTETGGVAVVGTGASADIDVYGRIAGGQNVPNGDYTDTVVVTVNF